MSNSYFQGVVCYCLDSDRTSHDTIFKLLDLNESTQNRNINCFNLNLKNKYYQATIHLFDFEDYTKSTDKKQKDIQEDCHAIIIYSNGQTVTTTQLDGIVEKLSSVKGEPRIFICDGIDEDCRPYKTLLNWSINKGFDFLLDNCEETKTQMIDSLSAYKWTYRTNATNSSPTDSPQLNPDLLKKIVDFDSLLGKLSAYRDRPEIRGNPNDRNIEEIAEILSGLLSDDVDEFLTNDDKNDEVEDDNNTNSKNNEL